ncbi:MAG: cupin domain-containing protein [Bacteroidales bacterium]|nr:cupin domain-containing protein [Bacteroidales bacterium]
MERRNFLLSAGLLTAFGAMAQSGFGAIGNSFAQVPPGADNEPMKQMLLPALPPLDHNGGMAIRTWVRSAMTNGLYSSVECAVAPKTMGPAPHWHKELDELMLVLEGTASILMDKEIVHIEAGGWHLRPRMIKHTFFNASDKPLRFIDMYFNQPFEEYLERVFYELTPENGFPEGSEAKQKEHERLIEKFGLCSAPDAWDERQEIAGRFGLK